MKFENALYTVEFKNSKEKTERDLQTLVNVSVGFLEDYGEEYLIGKPFHAIIQNGGGHSKFFRLLEATGCRNNPKDFFAELLKALENVNSRECEPVKINNIALPQLFLMAVMEKIIPGNQCISIKDVRQLEKVTNIVVPEKDRSDMQKVIETYPVRLSVHTIRQMRTSKVVAGQYLPFVEELDPVGHGNTWIGQFHQGLLEQMYQNRVIFLLNMTCPVYCRFCFRKHKASRNRPNPTAEDVKQAIEYVKKDPGIKEIVLTGGDPFLNKANMACAIDGLMEISHVQTLRLATRSIAYYPHLFHADDAAWLNYLKTKNLELQQIGKRMEIATHFIHPDEISPKSLDIISELVKNGIAVYVQTPFLKDCNDEGPELIKLFSLLRGAGAELHFIDMPCSPIRGSSIYWTPISKGLEVARHLRAHGSDRAFPKMCTATSIGKIDWQTSGWAVEQDRDNENFIWVRTPYTPEFFKAFGPLANDPDIVRVNAEGTLDARYMGKSGDESLFLGSRKPKSIQAGSVSSNQEGEIQKDELIKLRSLVFEDQRISQSLVSTGSSTLFRTHKTRVEIDIEANDGDLEYIKKNETITDIVISSVKDMVECLVNIGEIIKKVRDIHHVNAVRLRSLNFNYAPEKYTRAVVDKLGNLNKLTTVNPLRLEIETQFLHSGEFRPDHAALARALRNKGITVYNNTPLLSAVNDSPDEIHEIAYQCRKIGIEFHHLYIAGLPLQQSWNAKHPVDVSNVIDIATRIRRDGSGREIPGYIIRTELGEVDFGLTSRMYLDNGQIGVKLLPYELAYFQNMSSEFSWPSNVKLDSDGKPIVVVPGLTATDGFLLS